MPKAVTCAVVGLLVAVIIQKPLPTANAKNCSPFGEQLVVIDASYNAGQLETAKQLAGQALACPAATARDRVTLHLKLSAIYDRIGLHHNTRPVAESADQIDLAEKLAGSLGSAANARVDLARSKYFYRAEMMERKFIEAEKYGRSALAAFTAEKDIVGQADAVHALGLIYFQRRQLAEARGFFDQSLVFERSTGEPRAVMLADYGRHVGFIYLVSGDRAAAIPHFEQSFADRVNGGLKDPAMFAAITLASALVDEGRMEDAAEPLDYALQAAEDMSSPSGKVRALLVAGKFQVAQNNIESAKAAFIEARDIAEEIGLSSSASRAKASLERLIAGEDLPG